jgi:hypothetical protein
LPIEQKLNHEWTTIKQTVDGDHPKTVLKGTDHSENVEYKIELTYKEGKIPTAYVKSLGKPGDTVTLVLSPKSTQTELDTE